MNNQDYELERQQPQQQFSHSAKLTSTAKGMRIDVHCYANNLEELRQQLIKTYLGIETDLKNHCIAIAPMSTNGEVKS